jgi:hypothetical protein
MEFKRTGSVTLFVDVWLEESVLTIFLTIDVRVLQHSYSPTPFKEPNTLEHSSAI